MNLDEIERRANAATFGCWAEAAFNCARTDVPALIARVRELEAECAALRALLVDAHRELATIEAITVSPSGVDGLIELVNRIGQKLESSK